MNYFTPNTPSNLRFERLSSEGSVVAGHLWQLHSPLSVADHAVLEPFV
jgi:hypothetical protein